MKLWQKFVLANLIAVVYAGVSIFLADWWVKDLTAWLGSSFCAWAIILCIAITAVAADTAADLAKAQRYLNANELHRAEISFQKVLEIVPDSVPAFNGLAKTYAWQGRYDEAIEAYNKALKIDPNNMEAQIGLAEAYAWSGNNKDSLRYYENVLREDPRNIKVHRGLGQVYLWSDRFKDAERTYSQALERWPDNIDLRLGLAQTYNWMGDNAKAIAEYKKILAVDDSNIKAKEGLADAQKALSMEHDFSFSYTHEIDADDWQADTLVYGYKNTKNFDHGDNIYGALYVSDFRQNDYAGKVGETFVLGGRKNIDEKLVVTGSVNAQTYNNGPDWFCGGDINLLYKYFKNNSFSLSYYRDIFDVMDGIRRNRYVAESSFHLTRSLTLLDVYSYSDLSDSNDADDSYHALSWQAMRKIVDLSLTCGWRRRDYDRHDSLYYSPQDLESMVYSVYAGKGFGNIYYYTMFKLLDNSNHIDDRYSMLGFSWQAKKSLTVKCEAAYLDTEDKYSSFSASLSLNLIF